MNGSRSAPSRRTVLRSLAAAGAGSLAGCSYWRHGGICEPGQAVRRLTVERAEGPVEDATGWRLEVDVEHELVWTGDEPFETARLDVFDAEGVKLGDRALGPISEENGYDRSTESVCKGTRETYRKPMTLRTEREPRYVNPFVPATECSDGDVSTRPLVVGEDRVPKFRCTQRFPFEVFDPADAHDRDDWATLLFDAARTGHNPDGWGPGNEPAVAWTVPVGRDSTRPVVDLGAVYLTTGGHYAGDGFTRLPRGTLAAFDVETGNLAWSVHGGGSELGVAVADGTLFAGEAELVAYDATTGRQRWSTEPAAPLVTAPTVAGERVAAVDAEGVARAHAVEGGAQLWTHEVGVPDAPPLWGYGGVLAGGGESLYVVTEGAAVALDLETGEVRWRRSLETPEGLPQVGTDTVYVVTRDTLVALATDGGTERWRRRMDEVRPTVAIGPNSVYVCGNTAVSALSAADGTTRWSTAVDEARALRGLVNGRLYVAGRTGVHVLGTEAGGHVEALLGDVEFQFPVVAGGRIVDVSHDGALRVFADR